MRNPYKELASYEENDAKIFKGRSIEIQEMYENFSNSEYMVCYADSGEGKSSIIEAGLIPVLRSNFYYPIRIVFKDKDFKDNNMDFNRFVCQIISDEVNKLKEDTTIRVDTIYPKRLSNDKSSEMAEWEKQMVDSYAWLRLRYAQLTIDNFVFTPVLIFDQFEEVFTNPQSQEWTDSFFAWLQELTMDLCPKVIVNGLENKLGSEKFPQIATQKHFKAIFSLRSEYIGQLDYWGMQKHYIPQLKNNRYLLRPLTIAGAKEVITQQEDFIGLNDVAEDIVDILRNLQKGKNSVLSKDSELPCIPALFLSVVCSQAFSLPKQELTDFIHKLRKEGVEAVEKLIGQFYEKAVQSCEIPDKDLEIIEELLVNNAGIRQRISSQLDELRNIGFSNNYMWKLKEARLIRVIPEYNRPEESVELIHDCLCSVIKEKKEKRFQIKKEEAEIAEKNIQRLKGQREDYVASTYLFFLSVFIMWFLSTIYCDKVTAVSIGAFDTNVILSLGNFAALPFIIYGTIKRLKITTWISVYGLISNIALMYIFLVGQDKEMTLRTLYATVVVGVPAITLIYSFRYNIWGVPEKNEFRKLLKSIPLLSFFAIISTYMFYLSVFNTALGLPEPFNSSWGVIVVPLLCHEIIRNVCGLKQEWTCFVVFISLMCLLTYNSSNMPFAFSSIVFSTLVIGVVFSIIWFFRKLSWRKKIFAIVSDSIVVMLVILLNLGFNPLEVKYDNVYHVYNWIDVSIKDDNDKLGIVSATTGETIVPCVLDSIDYKEHYFHISSTKIKYTDDVIDYKGLYTYDKNTKLSKWYSLFVDEAEAKILKYSGGIKNAKTFQDSLLAYASSTYREVKNANIDYLISGKHYPIKKIKSLETLISLQDKELSSVLDSMTPNDAIDYKKVVLFYKVFAKSFCLCMLKDRILQKDSVNIFSLTQEFLSLYFYNTADFEININQDTNYNINGRIFSDKTSYKVSGLRENSIDAWHNYVSSLLAMELSSNAESYSTNKTNHYKGIIREIERIGSENSQKQKNRIHKLEQISKKGANISETDLTEALKNSIDILQSMKNTNDLVNKQIEQIEVQRYEADLTFRKLINDIFMTLSKLVLQSEFIYSTQFKSICEQLALISELRQYDIAPIYFIYLEKMENAINPFYKEMKKMIDEENEKLDQIKNLRDKIK